MQKTSTIFLTLFAFVSLNFFICKDQPKLNKDIVAFVKTKVNKKVGRGECWDLAAEALDATAATWDHDYKFGKIVNLTKNECVYPGDIIQFENVAIEYQVGNSFFTEDLQHHTAIIYTVKKTGEYVIAQQNTSDHGKKVSLDPFEIKWVKSGTFTIYRPQK